MHTRRPDGPCRRTALLIPLFSIPLLLLAGCDNSDVVGPNGNGAPELALEAEVVATGIPEPVHLAAPSGDDRLFVVEQGGRIRVIRDGNLLAEPFLDLSGEVNDGGNEQGLLSMAFHPGYAGNGWFYVNFTDLNGDPRVVRYTVSADPDVADPASAHPILEVEQPYGNHNGGHILFGPDGMLYVAMGDGGSSGDPDGNAQDPMTLLGALLRLDVDGGDPYAVPADNPYVGDPEGRDEIWAIGLRNPWRIAFDPPSGMLYVADVGQDEQEEVNVVPASEPGLNYGWPIMEGFECFQEPDCDPTGLVLPVLTYATGPVGCAIIGGHVYRGSGVSGIEGHYFYSDWCAGWLRSFRMEGGETVDEREWDVGELGRILSLGVDAAGELYILSSSQGGVVFRLVAGTP